MSETSLDYLGRFKDGKLQEEYVLYCLEQRSKLSFATIAIVILIWSIAESIVYTWFSDDDHGELDRDIDAVYGTVSLSLAAVGLVLCGILHYSLFNFQNRLVYSYLQVILIFTMNALFIIRATKQIHIGSSNCIPSEYSPLKLIYSNLPVNFTSSDLSTLSNLLQAVELPAQCPSSNSYLSLVNYFSVFVMCYNYQILTAIIYEPRLYIVWGCNLPTTALMLCSVFTSFYTLIPLLIGFLVVAFLLGELHYQRVQSFLNQRKILQLLDENEKNADAKQAMEMRHMISNIAHDLKTPLASFTNGLDLIQDILISAPEKLATHKFEQEASLRDCFSSIQTSLTNIRNTNAFMLMSINRCLDYTKASKGMKLKPKYETINLREVLQFPIECMSNIQERIGIQVEKLSEEICSHIITDKQWLQENILCLLSNAVKYSTEGTVKITVALTSSPTELRAHEMKTLTKQSTSNLKRVIPTISSYDSECERFSSLLFEVEDTGIGLSEEAAKNLFNPFKQAQRLAGGTGLGLYSLAKRMEALKGGYGVRKRKDRKQGSLFWFSIPYKPDYTLSSITHGHVALEQPLYMKNDRSLSSNCNPGPYEGFDILLVDDAPSILKMSSMMLMRQNHHISVAENGEIALRRIEEKWKQSGKGFDVVLMDLQMPVMDGLEATRRLRKMEAEGRDWMVRAITVSSRSSDEICEKNTEGTKTVSKHPTHQLIIGLSANSDHETATEALEAGVDDFFAKPFSINTFNEWLKNSCIKYF